jgi:hypothetical protein
MTDIAPGSGPHPDQTPGGSAAPTEHPASGPPGLDLPVTPGTATLIAYGRIAWDQVTAMLAEAQAAWADYNGFHIGPAPHAPPPYSHLWAWTADWLIRTRIDGQHAIAGALALSGLPGSSPPERWRQEVHFRRVQSQTWPSAEKRVGPLGPEVPGRSADLYMVTGDRPVTFVRVR